MEREREKDKEKEKEGAQAAAVATAAAAAAAEVAYLCTRGGWHGSLSCSLVLAIYTHLYIHLGAISGFFLGQLEAILVSSGPS